MHDTHQTCSTCRAPGVAAGPHARTLFPLVDDLGRSLICDLCLITLLARTRANREITVFMSRRPAAVA